mmetsp:Transcript_29242/g.62826  ORF Transcript_29242/g.62826 Transcript_29242/m.62826 type:complete len:351 (+) Transcript_29242:218-1270(+)
MLKTKRTPSWRSTAAFHMTSCQRAQHTKAGTAASFRLDMAKLTNTTLTPPRWRLSSLASSPALTRIAMAGSMARNSARGCQRRPIRLRVRLLITQRKRQWSCLHLRTWMAMVGCHRTSSRKQKHSTCSTTSPSTESASLSLLIEGAMARLMQMASSMRASLRASCTPNCHHEPSRCASFSLNMLCACTTRTGTDDSTRENSSAFTQRSLASIYRTKQSAVWTATTLMRRRTCPTQMQLALHQSGVQLGAGHARQGGRAQMRRRHWDTWGTSWNTPHIMRRSTGTTITATACSITWSWACTCCPPHTMCAMALRTKSPRVCLRFSALPPASVGTKTGLAVMILMTPQRASV